MLLVEVYVIVRERCVPMLDESSAHLMYTFGRFVVVSVRISLRTACGSLAEYSPHAILGIVCYALFSVVYCVYIYVYQCMCIYI